ALVLVPTRELAMQVAEAIHRYGQKLGVSVLPIYGGQPMGQQLRVLKRGVDVVVATPGRALDHLNRQSLLLDDTPEERQTALFSATLPPRIASIAERHLHEPVHVRIAKEKVAPGTGPR